MKVKLNEYARFRADSEQAWITITPHGIDVYTVELPVKMEKVVYRDGTSHPVWVSAILGFRDFVLFSGGQDGGEETNV